MPRLVLLKQPSDGKIFVHGKPVSFHGSDSAAKRGISSVSTDTNDNLFLEMDSYFNVSIANLQLISDTAFVHPRRRKLNVRVARFKQAPMKSTRIP